MDSFRTCLGGLGIMLAFVASGCGHGSTVCGVIDVADQACEVLPIRYMGPDGKERISYVPREELRRLAAKHGARLDGGAP